MMPRTPATTFRIEEDALYLFCREGRLTGQIPTLALVITGDCPEDATEKMVDIPAHWVYKTDASGLPTDSQNSFLFWSTAGVRENEDRLRLEFKASPFYGSRDLPRTNVTFADWQSAVEKKEQEVKARLRKRVAFLQKKLTAYTDFLTR